MGRNAHLEIGREVAIPGLAEGLRGMKANEERTLDLRFPDDHPDEELRGKPAKFSVRVSSVAEKVLPPLDDPFAKTVGVQDMASLRRAVRDELAHGAFHEARDTAADTAIAHAVSVSEVEVPELLVQDELDHMVADVKSRAAERGLAWERFLLQAKKTEGELREEWRPAAQRRAKSMLVLDAIAKKEGVTVSSTELAQEVALMPIAREDPQAIRSPQVLAALARSMRNRKTIDKLIGLDSPDAERKVLTALGASADAASHAGTDEPAPAPEPAEAVSPSGIIVPSRPQSDPKSREEIRKLMQRSSGSDPK